MFIRKRPPQADPTSIDGLVDQVKAGKLSRRSFVKKATIAGASAGGAAILLTAALKSKASATPKEQQNLQQHKDHVTRQSTPPPHPSSNAATNQTLAAGVVSSQMAHLQSILNDYHTDAVVEDTLTGSAIQGHSAIADRKLAEMLSIADPHIEVTRRYAVGDQVVAEWIFTGLHVGPFKGYQPTGNRIRLEGVTAVTRRDGKIVKETLYYDAAEVHRQLSAAIPL